MKEDNKKPVYSFSLREEDPERSGGWGGPRYNILLMLDGKIISDSKEQVMKIIDDIGIDLFNKSAREKYNKNIIEQAERIRDRLDKILKEKEK